MSNWESTRVPNLFRYTPTGEYIVRREVNGKTARFHLKTTVFTVAKWKMGQYMRTVQRAAGKTTMDALAEAYLQAVKSNPRHKPNYKFFLENRLIALRASWKDLWEMEPARVTPESVARWAGDYAAKYSASNYNNTAMVLKKIFEMAVEAGHIIENPARRLARARVQQSCPALPDQAQFQAIVKEVRDGGGRFSAACADLVEFLAYSGVRVLSEARWVQWSDIDLQAGTMLIRGDPVTSTKGSSPRIVPIIGEMRALLQRLRSATPRPQGRVMSVAECQKALNRACGKLGLPRLTHHDLRHLFATRCLSSGVDVPTVAQWLGHKDGGALLLKVYSHVLKSHSHEQAKKVQIG